MVVPKVRGNYKKTRAAQFLATIEDKINFKLNFNTEKKIDGKQVIARDQNGKMCVALISNELLPLPPTSEKNIQTIENEDVFITADKEVQTFECRVNSPQLLTPTTSRERELSVLSNLPDDLENIQ